MLTDQVGRARARPTAERRDLAYWGLAGQILALVFLQKFVVPIGGIPISVPILTLYAWLALMLLQGRLNSSGPRMLLVGLLFAATTVSQVFVAQPLSLLSYLQFLTLYLPFIFVWRVSRETHLRLMNVFQNAMLVGAAMVFLQLAWQAARGLGNMPNLEVVSPHSWLLQGYNYAAPIAWGEKFERPNGLFFLEPSFASSFLACALLIELMHFRRLWRVLVYVGALLGTVAATGVVVVAVAAVPLLARENLRVAPFTLLAGAVGAAAAFWTGALDRFTNRVAELNNPESSGWQRLIGSLIELRKVYASETMNPFSGVGAGNSPKGYVSLWPFAKMMIEYGVVPGVLLLAMIVVAMWGSLNAPLALGLFVAFNFTGGFLLVPPSVLQIIVLTTLLRAEAPVAENARQPPRRAPYSPPARPLVRSSPDGARLRVRPRPPDASTPS